MRDHQHSWRLGWRYLAPEHHGHGTRASPVEDEGRLPGHMIQSDSAERRSLGLSMLLQMSGERPLRLSPGLRAVCIGR